MELGVCVSDDEYFNDCINKITNDQQHLETLLQKKTSLTPPLMKNFNDTIHKVQINEQIYRSDIEDDKSSFIDIPNDLSFSEAQA